MNVLVGSGRLGPMTVFLPDGTHAAVGGEALTRPLLAQASAGGAQVTFEEHAQRLVAGSSYAGHWSLADVPDGMAAVQALHYVRVQTARAILAPPEG